MSFISPSRRLARDSQHLTGLATPPAAPDSCNPVEVAGGSEVGRSYFEEVKP